MTKECWLRCLATTFVLFFVVASFSATAQSRTLLIRISRLPQLDGRTTVEMDVGAFVHLPNGQTPSMVRPGIVAHPNFVFDSIIEFKEATIGEWTIEEPMTPFRPRETFTFQVSDFFDTISPILPPTIVSPMDGSVVPSVFTMTWAWPPGVTPQNSKATSIEKFGPGMQSGGSGSAHAPSDDLSEQMMAAYSSGGLPTTVEVRAGSWHPGLLDDFFSEVTPQQEPSINTYTIATLFYSYSLPARLYVGVPEPSAGILLAIGIGFVTMHHRRCQPPASLRVKTIVALAIVALTFSSGAIANGFY
jgi:hypothetical protein